LRVALGERSSEAAVLSFSLVNARTPKIIAAFVLLLLIIIIAGILATSRRPSVTTAAGVHADFASKFKLITRSAFIDEETMTYSLSKLQVILWLFAGVFGYVYLSASRSLVQGEFVLADIPKGLGPLLLIAVGTPALTTLISSTKGSKGAGEEGPSPADLITSGGVVAPDRLQYLIWTIVGVAAFVGTTLAISPSEILTLPEIPDGFLTLMGISSAGYVAGKMARPAGPVISKIEASIGSLILRLDGSSLSLDASFLIDDEPIETSMLDKALHPDGKPKVNTPADAKRFTTSMTLTLENFKTDWAAGEHRFTIVNPDRQRATVTYAIGGVGQTPATP
jgi:hypothetical protein